MGKCLYCNHETDKSIMINGFDGFDKKEQRVFCCCSEHAEEINIILLQIRMERNLLLLSL